jgi:hypothetical protein
LLFLFRAVLAQNEAIWAWDAADAECGLATPFAFALEHYTLVDVDQFSSRDRTIVRKACGTHLTISRRTRFGVYEVDNRTVLAASIA